MVVRCCLWEKGLRARRGGGQSLSSTSPLVLFDSLTMGARGFTGRGWKRSQGHNCPDHKPTVQHCCRTAEGKPSADGGSVSTDPNGSSPRVQLFPVGRVSPSKKRGKEED